MIYGKKNIGYQGFGLNISLNLKNEITSEI